MANNPSQNPRPGSRTVKECNDRIRRSLQTPMVKLLREHLEKAGCGIGDNFFKAVDCDMKIGGGYVPGKGIIVCANHLRSQGLVDEVVMHELIHAYDECRAANLNWSNCAHQACSEIRANHLSGNCHFKRELLRGNLNLKGQGKECVRRRAMMSVMCNPRCSEVMAKGAIEAVWDLCYNDTKPFDRAP
ncbi:mitochondrial inner membrane protease ATP23-like isoform X1 [Euphorbia lathyris]|uniref:mitochondrial inner membrane protease ATP23-like isoform X1 n=1 Tax=Euphorbia lathyris TaxID=212925 RepID=UPI0033140B53